MWCVRGWVGGWGRGFLSGGYGRGCRFSRWHLSSEPRLPRPHQPTHRVLDRHAAATRRRSHVPCRAGGRRQAVGSAERGIGGERWNRGRRKSGTSGGRRPHCRSVALDAGTRTEWSAWGVGRVCARRLGVGRRECKKNTGATSDDVVALVALASALATPPSLAPCFFSLFACKEKSTHTHTCPHHLPNEDTTSTLSLSHPLTLSP